jgi:hypothetical protein
MKRRLRELLAAPQTDQEEAVADRHIRRECERIRATWTPREHFVRRGGSRDVPVVKIGDEAHQRVDVLRE